MRHGISGRKLNRKSSHRIALLKNLSRSLIINEQIETTLPKAKDLRPFVEKILTMGKLNTLHSKRKVLSYLGEQRLVNKVFDVLAKIYAKRNGGYVRIIKAGNRYGDSAPIAVIELVERDVDAKGKIDRELALKKSNQESSSSQSPEIKPEKNDNIGKESSEEQKKSIKSQPKNQDK